jgi:hypothetical protein
VILICIVHRSPAVSYPVSVDPDGIREVASNH